jgi:hypothetical protein
MCSARQMRGDGEKGRKTMCSARYMPAEGDRGRKAELSGAIRGPRKGIKACGLLNG